VVDLLRHPECATREQIVAVPTLIWKTPSGMHTIVGDFSNHEKVLVGLEILPREDERHA
jgi:circadian clock protein KaiB